jgi:hypothetical protein
MVRKSAVTQKKFLNFTSKEQTIYTDKDNQYFKYKTIRDFVKKQEASLPQGSKMIVRGMNILRETTLKGYNGEMMTDEQHEEYVKNKVKNTAGFEVYTNFTITVLEPSTEPSMFNQHKSKRGKK